MHIIEVYFPLKVPLIEEVICLSTKLIPVKFEVHLKSVFFAFFGVGVVHSLFFDDRTNERIAVRWKHQKMKDKQIEIERVVFTIER